LSKQRREPSSASRRDIRAPARCASESRSGSAKLKERIYDALNRGLERRGFGERRDRLVGGLEGRVLEIGAGTGLNVPRYRRAEQVVVLEPDPIYGRRLRARGGEATVPVEVVATTAEQLPFADESFDHAVASLALCSMADVDAVLGELRRVLRPGGSLVFLEHVRSPSAKRARWQDRFTPLQRRIADGCHFNRDAPAAIEHAGLEITELERFTMPPGHPLIKDAVQGVAVKREV
jgi:ubiquinone/menaquinone biosynthesis C-methylase UbiE